MESRSHLTLQSHSPQGAKGGSGGSGGKGGDLSPVSKAKQAALEGGADAGPAPMDPNAKPPSKKQLREPDDVGNIL